MDTMTDKPQNQIPAPYIGLICPQSPDKSVHLFCYAGDLSEGPWESVAKCKWCRITPNGEIEARPK